MYARSMAYSVYQLVLCTDSNPDYAVMDDANTVYGLVCDEISAYYAAVAHEEHSVGRPTRGESDCR